MIEKNSFSGEDFKVVKEFEGWKVGFLRYSERFSSFSQLERHLKTDESFVLLEGTATLYTEDEKVNMEKCVIYSVPTGIWHHITVSRNATVMVVENSDTKSENTERRIISDAQKKGCDNYADK